MFNTTFARAILPAVTALAIASVPATAAYAHPAASGPASFGDFEYSVIGDATLPAELALARRIATRSVSIAQAVAGLRKAGGHLVNTSANGDTRLTFSTTEVVEEAQHDVAVTILVSQQGGLVRSVSVQRASHGS